MFLTVKTFILLACLCSAFNTLVTGTFLNDVICRFGSALSRNYFTAGVCVFTVKPTSLSSLILLLLFIYLFIFYLVLVKPEI